MAMVNLGVGVSQKENMVEAAKEAAEAAKGKTKEPPKLLIVYCTYNYSPEQYQDALREIQSVFSPDIPLVGGTVFSFFAENKVYDAFGSQGKVRGIGVLAIGSEYLTVGTGIGARVDKDPEEAGKQAIVQALDALDYNPSVAYMAMAQRGARDIINLRPVNGFILTPGGTSKHLFSENSILRGITSVTKRALRLTGGGLGGPLSEEGAFTTSFQFFHGEVYQESVIAVVLGSDLEIGYGTANGFRAMGPGAFITKAEGWAIQEINGHPAANALAEIFEKEAGVKKEEFLKAPLMSTAPKGIALGVVEVRTGFYWPITPLLIKGDSVVVSTEMKSGMGVALIKNEKQACISATADAAEAMAEDIQSKDFALVLMFSCALRGLLLQEQYAKEIQIVRSVLGEDVQVFGMGSGGEIGFYRTGDMVGTNYVNTMLGISNKLVSEI